LKRFITQAEVQDAARELTYQLPDDLPTPFKIWGVPRGGVAAAFALASMLDPCPAVVATPEEADVFIDDIYDSGKTASRYTGKPFLTLFDKRTPEWAGQWLVMPWEVSDTNHDGSADDAIVRLLEYIGEDPNREGLRDTPSRVLKAWRETWASGYGQDPASVLKVFEDGAEDYDELVFEGGIPFFSTCEHHLAQISGVAHIGYVSSGKKIIGLSKIPRLLEIFARRLQTQERITTSVANALMGSELEPLGVGVVLQARHACMETRGVHKIGTVTTTTALRGVLKTDPSARAEFLSYVHGK